MTAAVLIALAVVAAGAFVRWACAPVALAYKIGKQVERVRIERRTQAASGR